MTITRRMLDGSIVVDLMKRLEGSRAVDPLIAKVAPVVDRVMAPPGARSALLGRWLGHAIHPLLTDLPLGLWTATNVLDLWPVQGSRPCAQRLLALGLLSVPPVVVTGLAEWREVGTRDQRVGLVHAGLNVSGVALYTLSLISRSRDRHGLGVALALGGSVAVASAGYLGGHLTAVRKVSSRNCEFDDPSTGDAAQG
jgi:uncharacterized membrane protein